MMPLSFNVAMEGWLIIIIIIITLVLLLQWCLMVNQGGITISVQPTECKAAAAQSWVGLPLSSPADDGGGDDYDDDDDSHDGDDGNDYDTAAAAQSWIGLPLSSGCNT